MPLKYSNCQKFSGTIETLREALNGALRDLGAIDIAWSQNHTEVSAKVTMTWRSWGERIRCEIKETGEITVDSACVCGALIQWDDLGKNAINCAEVLQNTGRRLAESR